MAFYPYEFEAPISRHSMGTNARGELFYTVIYVPSFILEDMGTDYRPRVRVEGEIEDMPFSAALMPSRGQVYIMAPKALLQQIDADHAGLLSVRFGIGDQDAVEIPAALAQALSVDQAFKQAWEGLTPGKKRGYAYRVSSAKTAPTIEKRLAEVRTDLGLNL